MVWRRTGEIMGSTAASELVFFIVSIMVASVVAGALTAVVVDISNGIRERSGSISNTLGTSVVILNDPKSMPYDNITGVLTVYIRNTGKTPLHVNSTLFHIQGHNLSLDISSNRFNVSFVPENARDWVPDVVAIFKLDTGPVLSPGEDYSLIVWLEYGASASISFRV
jgi:archaellum component FlaG (FlaF/FlaG flagellin family)